MYRIRCSCKNSCKRMKAKPGTYLLKTLKCLQLVEYYWPHTRSCFPEVGVDVDTLYTHVSLWTQNSKKFPFRFRSSRRYRNKSMHNTPTHKRHDFVVNSIPDGQLWVYMRERVNVRLVFIFVLDPPRKVIYSYSRLTSSAVYFTRGIGVSIL